MKYSMHFHGGLLTTWVCMLLEQAYPHLRPQSHKALEKGDEARREDVLVHREKARSYLSNT